MIKMPLTLPLDEILEKPYDLRDLMHGNGKLVPVIFFVDPEKLPD